MGEILIFRDENEVIRGGVPPYVSIWRISQPYIDDVQRLSLELTLDEASKCGRKLIIDKEGHAERKTG